jgi:hypothetical protein
MNIGLRLRVLRYHLPCAAGEGKSRRADACLNGIAYPLLIGFPPRKCEWQLPLDVDSLVGLQAGRNRAMQELKSAASAFAVALYVGFLASAAAAQTAIRTPSPTTGTVRGANGPEAGTGLVSVLLVGAVVYLIGRRRNS